MTAAADLIATAKGYATTVLGSAVAALGDAKSAVQSVGYTSVSFNPQPLPQAPGILADLTPPALSDISLDMSAAGSLPGLPSYQDIAFLDAGTAPLLVATQPTITLPTAPSQLAAFLESAPTVSTAFTFPEPPAILSQPEFASPSIADRLAPVEPQVSIPAFGAIAPVDTSVAPTNLDVTFGNAYYGAAPNMIAMVNGYVDAQLAKVNPQYATQMAAIETQLTKYLQGGTGIDPAVEDAIYERSRSKGDAESRRARDQAYGEAAARGFTLPTGALNSAMQAARQASADNNAQAAREIVVMQADMEQKNLQFAVTTSTGLRTAMLSATLSYMQNVISMNGQALDYAKMVLSSIIETYNTAVKAFGLKLDMYKADAQVYEVRLRSAMAGIELYKVQIDALQALTNVDKAKVDVYRARIESLKAYADVYQSQIQAVLGRASLEKMKLDMFQVKVQAYTAQVQAKNSEWQGYTAAIEGQTASVKIYATQVDAFNSQVNAYKATIDAKAQVIQAQSLTNKARSEQYAAALDGYKTVISTLGEKARIQLAGQQQQVVAFQAKSNAAVANYQVKSEYFKATAQIGIENSRLVVSSMLASAENHRKYGETMANLSISSAKIYGDLAGASVSGMVTLAAETAAS